MKSMKIAILAGSLSLLAWSQGMPQNNTGAPGQAAQPAAAQTGQQPAAQPSGTQQAAASSTASTISGCLQESWGHFLVTDGSTTYDVRGIGTNLYDHENHTVQVKGLPDTKAAQNNQVPFYVQQVQDSGQTCGPNANASAQNTAQPGAGTPAGQSATGAATDQSASGMTSGQTSTGAIQQQTPGSMGAPTTGAQQDQNPPSATPQTANPQTAAPQTSSPQGTTPQAATAGQNGTSAQGNMSSNSQASATSQQTGTQSGGVEEKGTPTAGTPSSAVGAPASGSSPNSEANSQVTAAQQKLTTFNGCLSGSSNSYRLSANGKDYNLQGNTSTLSGMSGHQVEVTGEVFDGKAIQVNGARDLGSSCSK